MRSDAYLLKTIIEFCDDILDDLSYYGDDKETFYEEIRFQHSCSFCLFQIGENVKKLSDSHRKDNPQVNWREISGLRDIIGYAYAGIDLPRIWFAVTKEVPVLRKECILILEKIDLDDGISNI